MTDLRIRGSGTETNGYGGVNDVRRGAWCTISDVSLNIVCAWIRSLVVTKRLI